MVVLSKHNSKNEEIKLKYETYLLVQQKEKVKPVTAKSKLGSVSLYEEFNKYEDFDCFNSDRGKQFYDYLNEKDITAKTRINHLVNVKDFLHWHLLRIKVKNKNQKLIDLDTLEPTLEDKRLADRQEIVDMPTDEEVYKLLNIPINNLIDKRNQALIAFLVLTASRIAAVTTSPIKLVDIDKQIFHQDPEEGVHTKFDKYIISQFFLFDCRHVDILKDWIETLKTDYQFTNEDPLFPKIIQKGKMFNVHHSFVKEQSRYNEIIEKLCKTVGIKKFHPHMFRHYSLYKALGYVHNGQQLKALSQNVGHAEISTILGQYGNIKPERYTKMVKDMFACNLDLSMYSNEQLMQELIKRQKCVPAF